jgi:phospholipid/cholesterol/gamma-HCH transport system substrate-binding protein
MRKLLRRIAICAFVVAIAANLSGCGWRGVNSLPLPGTQGHGPGSFVVQAQLPDVTNIQQNSRVRVGDVTVGNVTNIDRQGWHALVTMRINGDVVLPANATATVGQTSLLGSMHIELAPPTNTEPQGRLHDGSLITLDNGSTRSSPPSTGKKTTSSRPPTASTGSPRNSPSRNPSSTRRCARFPTRSSF